MPLPPGVRQRLIRWLNDQRDQPQRDTKSGGSAVQKQMGVSEGSGVANHCQRPLRALDMRAVQQLFVSRIGSGNGPGSGELIRLHVTLAEIPPGLQPLRPRPLPSGYVLMDIETCGLRNMPVFLAGLFEPASGRVLQLLAPNQAFEPLLLAELFEEMSAARCLLTYNGSAFDIPFLADRARYWRLPQAPTVPHLDLLGLMRKEHGADLPSLRLASVESHVLGYRRLADVCGADIPEMYADFVRSPRPEIIAPVLAHNLVDLLACWAIADLLEVGEEHMA